MRVAPSSGVSSSSVRRPRNTTPRVYFAALVLTSFAMLGGCALKAEASGKHDGARAGVGPAIQIEGSTTQRAAAQAGTEHGGGCSASGEPTKGAVEQAAGVVALIALVLGLRRRFARRDDAKHEARPRERFYSIP